MERASIFCTSVASSIEPARAESLALMSASLSHFIDGARKGCYHVDDFSVTARQQHVRQVTGAFVKLWTSLFTGEQIFLHNVESKCKLGQNKPDNVTNLDSCTRKSFGTNSKRGVGALIFICPQQHRSATKRGLRLKSQK